ncbi:hypothetical protein CC80DRAFT_595221 [Byssothecium circinans]|uniref:Uncharacterized protein n=1 Tax=Byssothecium circinans TaxID=147558 RepID=A0A6A5TNS5_9PLEO|nr:hypothetical protein CC80DRAFT_595221 [Byssothecium circinans]
MQTLSKLARGLFGGDGSFDSPSPRLSAHESQSDHYENPTTASSTQQDSIAKMENEDHESGSGAGESDPFRDFTNLLDGEGVGNEEEIGVGLKEQLQKQMGDGVGGTEGEEMSEQIESRNPQDYDFPEVRQQTGRAVGDYEVETTTEPLESGDLRQHEQPHFVNKSNGEDDLPSRAPGHEMQLREQEQHLQRVEEGVVKSEPEPEPELEADDKMQLDENHDTDLHTPSENERTQSEQQPIHPKIKSEPNLDEHSSLQQLPESVLNQQDIVVNENSDSQQAVGQLPQPVDIMSLYTNINGEESGSASGSQEQFQMQQAPKSQSSSLNEDVNSYQPVEEPQAMDAVMLDLANVPSNQDDQMNQSQNQSPASSPDIAWVHGAHTSQQHATAPDDDLSSRDTAPEVSRRHEEPPKTPRLKLILNGHNDNASRGGGANGQKEMDALFKERKHPQRTLSPYQTSEAAVAQRNAVMRENIMVEKRIAQDSQLHVIPNLSETRYREFENQTPAFHRDVRQLREFQERSSGVAGRFHPESSSRTQSRVEGKRQVDQQHYVGHPQHYVQPYTFGQSHHKAYGNPYPPFDPMQLGQHPNVPYHNGNGPWNPEFFHGQMQMQGPGLYQQGYFNIPPPLPQHGFYMADRQPNIAHADPPNGLGKRKAAAELEDQRDEGLEIVSTDKEESSDEDDDDDEPLIHRVRRLQTPDPVFSHDSQHSRGGQFASSHSRPTQGVKHLPEEAVPRPTSAVGKMRPMPRRLPHRRSPTPNIEPDDFTAISWKLPTYAIDTAPNNSETGNQVIKVSLPGCIREPLLVSLDHPDQEIHLFRELFLPGQQSLAEPDPEPRRAILNFHHICVMVLDSYFAHQGGDVDAYAPHRQQHLPDANDEESGHDQGSSEDQDSADEQDTPRIENARGIDETDIYFATVDRWRAGLEVPIKKAYTLIRGPQEFTEIALDIIYYIKQHGMVDVQPKQRAERKDKGVKRGPQIKEEEDMEAKRGPGRPKGSGSKKAPAPATAKKSAPKSAKAGTWRGSKGVGSRAKPNELQSRKKAKTGKELTVSVMKKVGKRK